MRIFDGKCQLHVKTVVNKPWSLLPEKVNKHLLEVFHFSTSIKVGNGASTHSSGRIDGFMAVQLLNLLRACYRQLGLEFRAVVQLGRYCKTGNGFVTSGALTV
jgi:hypothetical protein